MCEALLERGDEVVCLDNFSTGHIENINPLLERFPDRFSLIVGDIRNLSDCQTAVSGADYVLHEAALGSVPRSIKDPATTNAVNISGFLNMLIAARDAKVKRFIFAASSSTYGDSTALPKVEDVIGRPLSPYAITKYVNELYADVFARTYGIEYIGLPLFVKKLIAHEQPTINGTGDYSRDFTYIDNVVEMNLLAMQTNNPQAVNQIYNTACGERTTLNTLFGYLKKYLSEYDSKISDIQPVFGPNRQGDIPHSLASIEKAKKLLGYNPKFNVEKGLREATKYYWENLK